MPGRILILFLLSAFVACSVKEDRTICPCALELAVEGGEETLVGLSVWDSVQLLRDSIDLRNAAVWRADLPRSGSVVSAMSGLHGMKTDGRLVLCGGSSEMGEVYAGTLHLENLGEEFHGNLRLRRQYAFINIYIAASERDSYPYSVRVRGNVDGFDILTLQPHPGRFEKVLYPVLGSWHRLCLPRQMDGSLEMEFLCLDQESGLLGRKAVFPVGEYIKSSGYDWYSEDLEDIDIKIDYASADVRLSIGGWSVIELLSDL